MELYRAGDAQGNTLEFQKKDLDSLIEPDPRWIKWLVKPGRGVFSFETAWRT